MRKFKWLLALTLSIGCITGAAIEASAETSVDTDRTQWEEALDAKCGLRKGDIVEDENLDVGIYKRVYASAAENAYWTKFGSDYYYEQLSDDEKQIWDSLEAKCIAIAVGTQEVEAATAQFDNAVVNMSSQELKDLLYMFKLSNPQYYFLDSSYGYYQSGNQITAAVYLYDKFKDGTERRTDTEEFREKIDTWVAQVAGEGRDEEKVKLAHDIIASNTDYYAGTYDQSAYSMVCQGQTVCAGYTAALQLLLNPNGIETIAVTSNNHAWNNVNIHDQWYAVDVTFDDQWTIYYDYYVKSNATIQTDDRNHFAEAMWDGYLPELKYDSTLSKYSNYYSPYFTEGEYVYFKVNDNTQLAERYAVAVESTNGADLNRAPSQVTYGGNAYAVLQGTSSEPEPEAPSVPSPTPEEPQSRNGLFQSADGNWYYYVNGSIDYDYTGLAYDETVGWWYVENGKINFNYNGLIEYNGTWWCVAGGQVRFDYTGLWCDPNVGWWYVTNGALNRNYTGMACNDYGWWYVTNGALDWNYTGMACNDYGWWYMTNGALDWNYTGMALNEYGWWYMTNGALDWNYTGMACNDYGWWYMTNGALDWNYTGMACNEYGWWYMTNGALDWNYTGMACNDYGWWYMTNGALDWNYTGMACNEYGWWYMTNGALDWNYTGMACNEYGWWYYTNGALDWNYTGLAPNEYGWWFFENGRINFGYTGPVEYEGATYNVVGGMVVF